MNNIPAAQTLRTIPTKKLLLEVQNNKEKCEECSSKKENCQRCIAFHEMLSRFANANIPVRYWFLSMDKFEGSEVLLDHFKKITNDIDQSYKDGVSYRLQGTFGAGKTMVLTSILKKALIKGYSALYITLNDIVNNLVYGKSDNKSLVRQELLSTDFLIIDEFDPRFFSSSDNASDLFARMLEDIVRHRLQNKLPTFFASNSSDATEGINGSLKLSLKSLFSYVKTIDVIGKDMRKEGK